MGSIQEVDAMMLLHKSSYVVKLIDHFKIDDQSYIVSKYAQGGDLLNYCLNTNESSRWLFEDRARHIFTQIAKGVRDMHRLGIFHRDLKLLNIFVADLSDFPKVKIGDLGLACKLDQDEKINQKCGTLPFMSPEQISKLPSDFKSDIWSLGVILFSVMSG